MASNRNDSVEMENRKVPFNQHPAAKPVDQLKANPRVMRIRVIVSKAACPGCRRIECEYRKEEVPELPTLACSYPRDLFANYKPTFREVYPDPVFLRNTPGRLMWADPNFCSAVAVPL